jgi:hypothetical protein
MGALTNAIKLQKHSFSNHNIGNISSRGQNGINKFLNTIYPLSEKGKS